MTSPSRQGEVSLLRRRKLFLHRDEENFFVASKAFVMRGSFITTRSFIVTKNLHQHYSILLLLASSCLPLMKSITLSSMLGLRPMRCHWKASQSFTQSLVELHRRQHSSTSNTSFSWAVQMGVFSLIFHPIAELSNQNSTKNTIKGNVRVLI